MHVNIFDIVDKKAYDLCIEALINYGKQEMPDGKIVDMIFANYDFCMEEMPRRYPLHFVAGDAFEICVSKERLEDMKPFILKNRLDHNLPL